MIEKTATIQNTQGIHCRPSAVIIKEAAGYTGTICVTNHAHSCNLQSVMELLTLGLHKGAQITIQVSGPQEAEFCQRLVTLFETHFDFPPRTGDTAPGCDPMSRLSS